MQIIIFKDFNYLEYVSICEKLECRAHHIYNSSRHLDCYTDAGTWTLPLMIVQQLIFAYNVYYETRIVS